jgi:hypothetical protein
LTMLSLSSGVDVRGNTDARLANLEQRMVVMERDVERILQRQQMSSIGAKDPSKPLSTRNEIVWEGLSLPSGSWAQGDKVRVPDIGKFAVPLMDSAERLGQRATDPNLSLNITNLSLGLDAPPGLNKAKMRSVDLGTLEESLQQSHGSSTKSSQSGSGSSERQNLTILPHKPVLTPRGQASNHQRLRSHSFEDRAANSKDSKGRHDHRRASDFCSLKPGRIYGGQHSSQFHVPANNKVATADSRVVANSVAPDNPPKKERGYVVCEDF